MTFYDNVEQAVDQIDVRDRRLRAAAACILVSEERARESGAEAAARSRAAEHVQAEYRGERDRMLHDRVIYDNAVSGATQAAQMDVDAVDRLRHRSIEMQRTIKGLVAMGQARGESVLFSPWRGKGP